MSDAQIMLTIDRYGCMRGQFVDAKADTCLFTTTNTADTGERLFLLWQHPESAIGLSPALAGDLAAVLKRFADGGKNDG